MIKTIALATLPAALFAAAPPEAPDALLPYIEDGHFEPDDFGWMKGAFPGASERQKRDYQTVQRWLEACSTDAKLEVFARLEELGVPKPSLDDLPIARPLCDEVAAMPDVDAYESYDEFAEMLATTRPVFDALVFTTELATKIAGPTTRSLADKLNHRTTAEQIYRHAYSWVWQQDYKKGTPVLNDKQKPIFSALLAGEVIRTDRENTEWLKQVIAEHGWPTISMVGERASQQAWLLAQHADHDPVLQLEVLRLMEPLVEKGEVSQRNYAYLYDRVMLKLVGKQRFATQTECKEGERVASELEDKVRMPEFRQSMGLEPFEEYMDGFQSPCP
ncbi:DUF6624 domain-containing protein [Blastomonas marina]|uniref:DUF6624 domain-containing protein n=1 Tax=Blastomonas marina TaxID=1867408 RepID=UPI002AC8C8C9|nr:DUF6624 domain-containing protein [Blastomonas marina]WPZ04233.1 DUF6624 domain-containing protein [Blastomonas marina]